jgi:hypothetical protein
VLSSIKRIEQYSKTLLAIYDNIDDEINEAFDA